MTIPSQSAQDRRARGEHDEFIDAWIGDKASSAAGAEASIGLTKRVTSGHLQMGSRFHPREYTRERDVLVHEFEMANTAVTVNQYAVFLSTGAVREQRWWSAEGWAWVTGQSVGWGRANRFVPDNWGTQQQRLYHPVTGLTFYEAEAYCRWVSDQKKTTVRLPTEAEWEYAARGEDQRPFPWGELFDATLTNTLETGLGLTNPAGTLTGDASPFGILELAGNVQEWTTSPYQPLPDETYPLGTLYVARGGSFYDQAFAARTTYRRAYPPGYFFPHLGFRIVLGSAIK